jgi:hypothetical protein
MAKTVVRQRIIGNPGRRRRHTKARAGHRRKKNPGAEILGFVLGPAGNPGRKKGGSMARKRRRNRGTAVRRNRVHRRRRTNRKSNPGLRAMHRNRSTRRRRRNPGVSRIRRMNRHHRRRNPGDSGIGAMFTNAVFVIVGALGSKLGAQAVLGTNNVGVVGYAGNAATGAVLWFLAEKVMKNRNAANGIVAGTIVQIILRVINDYTPFGSYVANLGMGDYQMQSFVTPQVLVNPMQNANIQIPAGWGGGGGGPAMSATAGVRQMRGGGGGGGGQPAITAPAAASSSAAPASGVSGVPLYGGSFSGLYGS